MQDLEERGEGLACNLANVGLLHDLLVEEACCSHVLAVLGLVISRLVALL
jgi:hypothetical protein